MTTVLMPSTYQRGIYEWIRDGVGSAAVIAVAGSGKTTTLVEGLRYRLPMVNDYYPRVQFYAFNTKIADELAARTAGMRGVTASTFHSAGYGALCRKLGMQKLPVSKGASKLRGLCWDWLGKRDAFLYADFLCELVSLAKGEGIGAIVPDEPPAWKALVDHHGLVIDGAGKVEYADVEARGIELARELLLRNITAVEDEYVIDFDDMLYMPLFWDLELMQAPWVFLDEAQDTNPVRREIVRRTMAEGGRLVAVGDKNQAIYGFTGASVDAMDLIIRDFHTTVLPLSVCYRCARSIVEEAQFIVPDIEPCDTAPEGEVCQLPVKDGLAQLAAADAVLCRNTAPLMRAAYWLIARGVGCRVLGKEIGVGLLKLVDRLKATDLDDLLQELYDYRDKQTAKLRAKGEDEAAASLEDRVDSLQHIILNLKPPRTVERLKEEIGRMFASDDPTVGLLTLSTIHKAKGLEWPTVAILQPELMPSVWAEADWQLQQETNLKYVAITRARERLIWLEGVLEA